MIKNKRGEGNIRAHYGMTDYYRYFIKEYNLNISTKVYNNIIADFNEAIMNLIIEENLDYRLPHVGSTLSVRKIKRSPKIINGKLHNPTPINWVATNKLWAEDEEAKDKKLLVRYNNSHTSGYVYRIYFKKYDLYYKNKKIYNFKVARDFSRMLGNRINDEDKDKFNAYLLY